MWTRDISKGQKLRGSAKVWLERLGLASAVQEALIEDIMSFLDMCWKEEAERIAAAKEALETAAAVAKEAGEKKKKAVSTAAERGTNATAPPTKKIRK
jgi:hypothetical protein